MPVSSHLQGTDVFIMMNLILMSIVILLSKADSVCIDTSALTQGDVYLENSLYDVTSVPSLLDCAADCSSKSDCLSFGFERTTGTCHQHVKNSTTGTSEMTEKKNWVHGNIALWPQALLGVCSDHNCKKGDRCMTHRITMAPMCVKAKVSLPPGYCPVPVDIPNANISWGKQLEGSVRTHTCNHGYLDTSLDAVRAVATCMTDGEWSKIQLTCSGPYIQMETPYIPNYSFTRIPSETFQHITSNNSSIIFLVKTCLSPVFGLYTEANTITNPTFEIVIGGWKNNKSVIRRCFRWNELQAEHNEAGMVSCSEFRPFWLSWENGRISVGKGGAVGEGKFMEWKPRRHFRVNNVGISTYINNTGRWLFFRQK